MADKLLKNPHAGDILKIEFLDELTLSQNALARAINVPANRINAIINGTRRVTADTDLRLCKYFGLSEGFWLRLQNTYETREAKHNLQKQIAQIIPYHKEQHTGTL